MNWKGSRLPIFALLAAATLLGSAYAARGDVPARILSINLCADQLLVALADRRQIAGLSRFATDPEFSVAAQQAQSLPRTDQRSEAAIALQPDLVLAGPSDRSAMRRVLAGLGLRVHEVPIVTDIARARTQVREVAALIGQPARGEALVAEIDAAQARLAAVAHGQGKTALLVERKGYVTGPDSLAAALLRVAGFVPPVGAPHGLGGFIPLERLLMLRPDVLMLHDVVTQAEDQGALFLTHPALAGLYPPERRLFLPRRFSLCGGPALVAALDYLTQVLSPPTRR